MTNFKYLCDYCKVMNCVIIVVSLAFSMFENIKKYILISLFLLLCIPVSSQAKKNSVYSAFVPNDKYYDRQWYLNRINAEAAWDISVEETEVVIAIIDSGVQINHPDLSANIWTNYQEIASNGIDDDKNGYTDDVNGWDFVNEVNNPNPKFIQNFIEGEISHGTIIAGIVAAITNNSEGIAGLAMNTKIMPLLVLNARGEGSLRSVIRAIDYAVDNDVDIINLSFVGESYNAELEAAIRRAYKAGVLVIAAAGNNDEATQGRDLSKYPMYPVCNDGYYGENMVMGVAATDALDQKTSFSGFGTKCVDISAPGVSIFSTSLVFSELGLGKNSLNKYYDGYWAGTSMATPLVSAAAALTVVANPSLDRQEVFNILQGSSDYIEKLNPEYFEMLGAGRLNAGRAVAMAKERLAIKNFQIINSPFSKATSSLMFSDIDGKNKNEFNVLGDFVGGVNVAIGDINNDGISELIVSAGFGGGPMVQIFSKNNKLINQFFAYDKNFRGGVSVAVGDIDGDGLDDIVTGAGPGGGPHVRAFNNKGEVIGQFFAYDKNFRGGVSVAVGDIDGDGLDDIITGAGPGGGPQVRVFTESGKIISQFFAYDKNFRGGVNVSAADVNGGLRKYTEIITAPASLGGPHIRVFDHFGILLSEFFAYSEKYRGGINIGTGDIDKDGLAEIVTGAGVGGTAHVKSFEIDGTLLKSYMAYDEYFLGGVNVAVLEY